MGRMMMQDDVYIGSFFDLLNLRFAPSQELLPTDYEHLPSFDMSAYDGIEELKVLQAEFQIFAADRSFRDSIAILNLGGTMNTRAKLRWHALLGDLNSYPSNIEGQDGDEAIVGALIQNLQLDDPLPVHFKAHDSREPLPGRIVYIETRSRPVFYLDQDFITVSLPMKPRTAFAPGEPVAAGQ